jgi:hypothetical protein
VYITQPRLILPTPPSEGEKTLTHHLLRNLAAPPPLFRSDQGEPKDSCMVLSYGDKNNSGAGVKAPIGHLIVADVLLVSCKDNHLCVFEIRSGRIMAKKAWLCGDYSGLGAHVFEAQPKSRRSITM